MCNYLCIFLLSNVHVSLNAWAWCRVVQLYNWIFCFCSGDEATEGIDVLVQPGFIHTCWLGFAFPLFYIHSFLLILLLFFLLHFFSVPHAQVLRNNACRVEQGLTLLCTNWGGNFLNSAVQLRSEHVRILLLLEN